MHCGTFPFFLQFPFLLLSLQSLPFFVSFLFPFSPFSLLFLPILPFFLHSVPFFSFFYLLLCFHFHSVPTNSPFVCRTIPWLFNESHTNSTFFMFAVRAALTAKFTKHQDDILFASQLASFLICSSRTPPCHTRSVFSLFLQRFATPLIRSNTSAGTICHSPLRSNSFKQQTASSPSENHIHKPTFLRNSLSPRINDA